MSEGLKVVLVHQIFTDFDNIMMELFPDDDAGPTPEEAYNTIALLGSALTLTVLKFSRMTEFSMS